MDDPASLKLLTGTRRKLPGHKGTRKKQCLSFLPISEIWH
ncbi:hypothetical protein HMPREF3213_01189 [Heyndrickxia coagulans]|uniref:Uncharacterized protein n=1 Tax=Heyndrickxia coagulans TaxID=1398 RepID=A0A133KWP1_HEYCO|nr:hypothetical protein HMPREF3213_01189 [Heyndrickxia coagulans]